MTAIVTRRHFLRALGIGAVAVAAPAIVVPELVEPRRRIWQVSRNAPVGLHRVGSVDVTFDTGSSIAFDLPPTADKLRGKYTNPIYMSDDKAPAESLFGVDAAPDACARLEWQLRERHDVNVSAVTAQLESAAKVMLETLGRRFGKTKLTRAAVFEHAARLARARDSGRS